MSVYLMIEYGECFKYLSFSITNSTAISESLASVYQKLDFIYVDSVVVCFFKEVRRTFGFLGCWRISGAAFGSKIVLEETVELMDINDNHLCT